jgi:hypothetical protein
LLAEVPISESMDTRSFIWGNATYTSAIFYQFMFSAIPPDMALRAIWKSKYLPKLKVFVWLLLYFIDTGIWILVSHVRFAKTIFWNHGIIYSWENLRRGAACILAPCGCSFLYAPLLSEETCMNLHLTLMSSY